MAVNGLIDLHALESEPTATAWEDFAAARRHLAAAWLAFSPEEVRFAVGDELGRLHRAVSDAGIRSITPAEIDLPAIEQIKARFKSGKPISPGLLLAAMLYLHPYEFGRLVTLDQVPDYLGGLFLRLGFEIPTLLRRPGEADEFAAHLTAWLQYLLDQARANPDTPAWRSVVNVAAMSINAVPAYFTSANLLPLMSARARLIELALKLNGMQPDGAFGPRPNRPRIRLGVLARHFTSHTETFATLPVYHHLSRQKFEIILLTTNHTPDQPLERFCAGLGEQFIVLPSKLAEQANKVRSLDLDVLWIGSNITAVTDDFTQLCAHRLARMQVASVCSCVSTGFKNIDYYVSGRLSEPPTGAAAHYSEKLLMIDGPAHCYDFAEESGSIAAAPPLSRADVNIGEHAIVFASGANFFKILPELDEVWARILAATPGSRLLLYPFNPNWTRGYPVWRFVQRLRKNFERHGVGVDRLVLFEQAPNRSVVLSRLALADIYLDSFPFAGATSLLDPLELHIPSLAMDGSVFRSLVGPAMLRELKLDNFIARDVQGYIDLAVRLATSAADRAAAKDRFAAAMRQTPKFLDSKWYAGEVERVLIDAWNSRTR